MVLFELNLGTTGLSIRVPGYRRLTRKLEVMACNSIELENVNRITRRTLNQEYDGWYFCMEVNHAQQKVLKQKQKQQSHTASQKLIRRMNIHATQMMDC